MVFTLVELVRLYRHELHDFTASFHEDKSNVVKSNVYLDFLDGEEKSPTIVIENENKDKIIFNKDNGKSRQVKITFNNDESESESFEFSEYDNSIKNLITFIELLSFDLLNNKIKIEKE